MKGVSLINNRTCDIAFLVLFAAIPSMGFRFELLLRRPLSDGYAITCLGEVVQQLVVVGFIFSHRHTRSPDSTIRQ